MKMLLYSRAADMQGKLAGLESQPADRAAIQLPSMRTCINQSLDWLRSSPIHSTVN
jgi:hypothetical protein